MGRGILVLAAAGVVWNRGGVTNASKSILSLGRSVFFRSPRKRSSACPWRRTNKVALKRMGWVALEELDKVALKVDDN